MLKLRASQVCTCSLWIIGEYSASEADIAAALDTVKGAIGPLPLFREDDGGGEGEENGTSAPAPAQVRSRDWLHGLQS